VSIRLRKGDNFSPSDSRREVSSSRWKGDGGGASRGGRMEWTVGRA
jgi:hypothetical protein